MPMTFFSEYLKLREMFFIWRGQVATHKKFFLALGMAALTGLIAQISIPVPGTPVPITGQTFAVLLSGVILGRRLGGASQALYVGLGALGLPWYADLSGGGAHLFGPTGGYLLGFILASLFLGYMTDRYPGLRGFFSMAGLMWFASFVLIQVPGLGVLALWYRITTGSVPGFYELVSMGMLPFVVGDVLKIMLAAGVAKAVTPK